MGSAQKAKRSAAAGLCPVQVLIYNGRTNALERQITRFKDIAYSGCFRSDARLLTAGGESGVVQVSV